MVKDLEAFLNAYTPEKKQRFRFEVPDNVEEHLFRVYKKVVEFSGKKYIENEKINSNVRDVASWMKSGSAGLILFGSVGTGKTAIVKALGLLFAFYTKSQNRLEILKAAEVNKMALSKDERIYGKFESLEKLMYLAIDEVGGHESSTVNDFGTTKMPLIELLHAREEQNKVTIITTNLDGSGLHKHLGTRIADRLREFDSIMFDGESFRGRK